ncbi:MAG TPA: hypothetical protein VGL53_19640, partial [Bryobacteraceae bacterium]
MRIGRAGWTLIGIWAFAILLAMPALQHWKAPAPATGLRLAVTLVALYAIAGGICWVIYIRERSGLGRRRAGMLVFLTILLTFLTNHIHRFSVDDSSSYFGYPAVQWQVMLQDKAVELDPGVRPHSYRFLPNSAVRWVEMTGVGFAQSRDFYRLVTGLLLFYALFRFARLYCEPAASFVAMLLAGLIYPVSYEYYAGQLTDPLSHLSFILAFIFLETGAFGLLVAAIGIGSMAKESVLALVVYYAIFKRGEPRHLIKSATLFAVAGVSFLGARLLVLGGSWMRYDQISGVTLKDFPLNWHDPLWPGVFILTACAFTPVLVLYWKETPLELKRLALFLLPVLAVTNMVISWMRESRNFMPVVFVFAVIAARAIVPVGAPELP